MQESFPLAASQQQRIICSGHSSGGIAQLVERLVRNEKVSGSNPLTSTKFLSGNDNHNRNEVEIAGQEILKSPANRNP